MLMSRELIVQDKDESMSGNRLGSLLLLMVMTGFVVGCHTTSMERHSYEYEILSEPSGATVWTDEEEREKLGVTPLASEIHYETKLTNRSTAAWASTIALGAAAQIGVIMGAIFFLEDIYPVAGGLSLLGGIGAGLGGWALFNHSSPETYVRPLGADQWTSLSVRDESAYLNTLLPRTLVLERDGFPEREAPGPAREQISMTDLALDPSTAVAQRSQPRQRAQSAPPAQTQPRAPVASMSDHVIGAPQPNAHALVVGIENYRSITPTPGARDDAERFARMLEDSLNVPERNIHLLTDENATRGDILARIDWLKNNVSSDARIYFFFSGHGSPDVQSGESYILPYESQPETLGFTGLKMEEVLQGLEQTPARDILAFVDSCFSGSGDRSSLPEGTRPLVPVEPVQSKPRVALFASSAANEISGNAPDSAEGLFTRHLLNAIGQGRADIDGDGQISLAELEQYVGPRVARDARQVSREQNPMLSVSDELGAAENIILIWGLPRD